MSSFRPDLLIKDSKGDPIAVVEVKNLQGLSRDEAAEIRHDLLEYGLPDQIPYFLLLSQDMGFLWKEPKKGSPNVPPTYEFPMDQVVERYLKQKTARRLYGRELELLVLQWLLNLATKPQQEVEEPEKTLSRSGFNEDIKGADILMEQPL